MRPGVATRLLCAVLAIAAVAPSNASAATRFYEGGISDVAGSTFGFTVQTKRVNGKQVRTVTEVHGQNIPAYCDGSSSFDSSVRFAANARVSRGGAFEAAVAGSNADGYDFLRYVGGRINGDRASGRFSNTAQNPIFNSCSTGVVRFYADRVTND